MDFILAVLLLLTFIITGIFWGDKLSRVFARKAARKKATVAEDHIAV